MTNAELAVKVDGSRFIQIDLTRLSAGAARAIVEQVYRLDGWEDAGKAVNDWEAFCNDWMNEGMEAAYRARIGLAL